jgi:hypothetical protein
MTGVGMGLEAAPVRGVAGMHAPRHAPDAGPTAQAPAGGTASSRTAAATRMAP